MGKNDKKKHVRTVYINQPVPLQVRFVSNVAAQMQTKPKSQWITDSIYIQSRAYLQSRGMWDGIKQAYKDTTGFEFDENVLSPLAEEAAVVPPKAQEGDEIDEDLLAEEAEEVVNA